VTGKYGLLGWPHLLLLLLLLLLQRVQSTLTGPSTCTA
jgi:hypothetical protein